MKQKLTLPNTINLVALTGVGWSVHPVRMRTAQRMRAAEQVRVKRRVQT